MTEIYNWKPSAETDLTQRALDCMKSHQVVALPTETVYGLFVLDHPVALDRLYQLKGRDVAKPMAHYVADLLQAESRAGYFPPAARRLAQAFWPGPLTIVIESKDGLTRGWRCSSHPLIRRLAAMSERTLLGTSANRSGEEPLATADAIHAAFDGALGMVVRDDTTDPRAASTVVMVRSAPRVPDDRHVILRAGGITADQLVDPLRLQILFICTGNTCRSPLAEVIAKKLVADRDPNVRPRFLSAGLAAWLGDPASSGSLGIATAMGLDLSSHRSQPVGPELIDSSDLIFTMTESHRARLVSLFPEYESRIHRLDPAGDVLDPIGAATDVYRQCAEQITRSLRLQLEKWT